MAGPLSFSQALAQQADAVKSFAQAGKATAETTATNLANAENYRQLAAKIQQGDAYEVAASVTNLKNKVQNKQLGATLKALKNRPGALQRMEELKIDTSLEVSEQQERAAKATTLHQITSGARGYDDYSAVQMAEELREEDEGWAKEWLDASPFERKAMQDSIARRAAVNEGTLREVYLNQNKEATKLSADQQRILTKEGSAFRLEEQAFDHRWALQERKLELQRMASAKTRLGQPLTVQDSMGNREDLSKLVMSHLKITLPEADFIKDMDPGKLDSEENVKASMFTDNFVKNLNDVMKYQVDAYNKLTPEQKAVTTPPDPVTNFDSALATTLSYTGTDGTNLEHNPRELERQKTLWKSNEQVQLTAQSELMENAKLIAQQENQRAQASGQPVRSQEEIELELAAFKSELTLDNPVYNQYLERLWTSPVARGWTNSDAMKGDQRGRAMLMRRAQGSERFGSFTGGVPTGGR